jgi:hypothetical protein
MFTSKAGMNARRRAFYSSGQGWIRLKMRKKDESQIVV